MKTTHARRSERGNALFLILIAVALFAALSYAVTQSGRGSGSVSREQSLIAASQITQFPAGIRTAVTRMVITGVSANDVSFIAGDDDEDFGVFSATGGGASRQDPPANIGTATDWRFKAIPTKATGGYFITGVGTGDDVAGRDSFAFLEGVSTDICRSILRGLGLSTTPLQEATTTNLTDPTPANEGDPATQAGGTTATSDDEGNNLWSFNAHNADPQAFSCVDADSTAATNFVYYHALIEQ